MKVEIGFDLSLTQPSLFFILDDPVRGVLDNTVYVLGGDVLVDVTDYTRAVQVRRGRSRELEKFTAGNANVTLDNRARTFDPTYAAGPYFGSILPGKQVVITVDDAPLYRGNVADWNLGYTINGDSIAEPSCVDAFDLLSNATLTPDTATAQATGARVEAVLDSISWPDGQRRISGGQATLDADVIPDGTTALAYLQKVETSEPGALFIGRDGAVTFLDRADLQNPAGAVVFGGTGIPFTGIDVVYGTEELTNQASVVWSAGSAVGGTATATNTASVTAYGAYAKSYDTLLDDAGQAGDLADWVVAKYGQPLYRIDRLTVTLDGLGASHKAAVLGLDLGSVARVDFTPNGIGSAISQYVTVDGIEHSASPARHDVTLTLSETLAGFVLDDATFGVLDTSTLGF